ncbi:hypothetical protein AVEN_62650-1 [Araneus ventricosus]|uniref:Tc1-like transposase DDE domain-containing protein n=1 Tax=Araneus ventricosus TaxID=182803 RepID=A0A4Y2L4G8_ARAVE|nr:hypothetical protein AVEN_62650-1 [Araneus ventricosus]
MVWDVCSWRDMGPLIRLETTLTLDRYLSNLSDHLHSYMSIVHSDGLGQFQKDNATPHASRVATKWLHEHSSDFRHFHWSPKSLEMNIIEDIRDALLHAPTSCTPMDLLTACKIHGVKTNRMPSDISRDHATSCCNTFACSFALLTSKLFVLT